MPSRQTAATVAVIGVGQEGASDGSVDGVDAPS